MKLRKTLILASLFAFFASACEAAVPPNYPKEPANLTHVPKQLKVATFAGGCFWCMEKPFDMIDGVISTTSGYIDGFKKNPTYREVSNGSTGHTEAIQIVYDPKRVSFEKLLSVFWRNIDPTVENRQFCDKGSQYRSGIYYYTPEQEKAVLASKAKIVASRILRKAIKTEIKAASRFYPAEEYHQDFYKKNPAHYQRYRYGCGRDQRLQELWGSSKAH